MKLLLSSLLLASLCALSSWSVSSTGTPAVTQTPDVSVAEGETVNISCCWTLNVSRIRVRWMKNQTKIKNDTVKSKNHSQGFLQNAPSHCSHLTFTNVTREDSGRYVCMVIVEIPTLYVIEGNGTVITVTARNNTTDSTAGGPEKGSCQEVVLINIVRWLLILVLIITFVYVKNWRPKAQQHTPAALGNEEEEDEDIKQREKGETMIRPSR